ncbi:Sodium-coupled monocarboxylate transporter 1 [Toxocara canis]|uniref:Sodium-coupled monocarboxylate transporter 1 n=1 Tax=Toxocara canis TaxID=6265 RepID=A0A0B2UN51_TOXCA|nr:Sodium-coupled monocarboxylate transporter 1 [Toxocara canis]
MDIIDIVVLVGLMAVISFYGLYKSFKGAKQSSADEVLHGSNVSILSSALSVCSGFLSAISLLGFPAEIYYQGTMLYWYGPMYMVAFPLVAFVFLPVFYRLKLTSIYEYLELRFNFGCRFLASITFCIQTLLYISVGLYAPALALSSIVAIPLSFSILLTAGLSTLYISVGGAKAGIYTSSLQMGLILMSMSVILFSSIWGRSFSEVVSAAAEGGRLQFADFRIDPRIRHSVWSLMIGGTGNILSLFAANQLSIQRYMAMPSLKSAKWVVLLNIPFNFLILTTYVGIGLVLYHAYRFCDPIMPARDRLFPHFIIEQISVFPGLIGIFLAAIYSAGLSTLSASYSALGAVVIEDVIKQYLQKLCNGKELKSQHAVLLARLLPLLFCALSVALAYTCSLMETMMLQISLTIFGVAGGPVLSAFCLGFFFPHIRGIAAFVAQSAATLFCFFVAGGALMSHVRPVGLPLDRSCGVGNITHFDISDSTCGMVHPLNSDSWLVQLFRISYQYYSIMALIMAIIVAHIVQFFTKSKNESDLPINTDLLSALVVQKWQTQNECYTPTKRTKASVLSVESGALKIGDNAL